MDSSAHAHGHTRAIGHESERTLDPPEAQRVNCGYFDPGGRLPLVLRPRVAGIDLAAWIREERTSLDAHLARHGALLWRGFGVGSIAEFENVARAACDALFSDYGDLPREEQGHSVYQSTPYPSDKAILFHNESSHLPSWPMKQFFYCVTAAPEGGETPIVDCREVYRRLPAALLEPFESKGLLYVRNFAEGLDVHWREFFRTDDRAQVEEHCRRLGIDWEWIPKGLCTRQWRPAVSTHPGSGERVFFNQIQLHHAACLGDDVRDALLSLFGVEGLPRHVYYGDGTAIRDEDVAAVTQIYRDAAVAFRWEAGDVLMLDNMLVAHARNPFRGPRKIAVAMGDMRHDER